MKTIKNISRRHLFKGAAKGSFILGASIPTLSMLPKVFAGEDLKETKFIPSVYLEIRKDNTVAVICHRSEMGQGVRTSIPMIVADELGADWAQIEVVQGLGDPKYGNQNTDGSASIRLFYGKLREAGATARYMLTEAAAQVFKVEASQCRVDAGKVLYKNRALSFGELAELASTMKVPEEKQLVYKNKKEFKFIGSEKMANIDGHLIATGKTVFGIDVEKENLHIAIIARPPVMGAHVVSFDASEALKVKGVVKVIKMPDISEPVVYKPLGGVAVLATNTWAAMQGRDKLNIVWSKHKNADYDSAAYFKKMEADIDTVTSTHRTQGDVSASLKRADKVIEHSYYMPNLAHAPMETPAATADWRENKVEVWAATQNPQSAVDSISSQLGIDKAKVDVHVTLLGGAFGRKSKQDFVVEAAFLSREAKVPVKVVWSREDDIKHDYYQACTLQKITAGLNDKKVSAWRHRESGPGIQSIFKKDASGVAFEPNMGMKDVPFDITNVECTSGPGLGHVRYGWMRSVANIGHAFSIGSFVDELADELGIDTHKLWHQLIGADRHIDFTKMGTTPYANHGETLEKYPYDTKRLKATLDKVASMAKWGRSLPKGEGLGISVHRSFVSNTACCVKVSEHDGKIKVDKVWMAIDAGTVINKERVRSQLEGSVIFALSLAFYGEITAKNGVVEQNNFDDYEVLRIDQSPEIEVAILDFDDPLAGGVGEPGVPPITPALCNAIFAATGKRYRKLPLMQYGII